MALIVPKWRLYLADSSSMAVLGELKRAKGRSLEVGLNQPGSCGFSLRVDDPLAYELSPWETCVIAQRNSVTQWSGPVMTINSTLPDDNVAVTAVGWFERLNRRSLLAQATYANKDAGLIGADLVNQANLYGDTYITVGTVEPSQTRNRTYAVDTNIGTEIQQLASIESGFDWEIDPTTRQISFLQYRGTTKTNCAFVYGIGPNNVATFSENIDGSIVVNDMRARGKFATGFAEDTESKSRFGTLQENPSLSDVIDTNILNAYANAEIVYKAFPRTIYDFTPKATSVRNVPALFDDFDIGDTVFLSAERGRVQVHNQAVRAFSATISIQDDGSEKITRLQTSST